MILVGGIADGVSVALCDGTTMCVPVIPSQPHCYTYAWDGVRWYDAEAKPDLVAYNGHSIITATYDRISA